ncbi:MAG: hypothetical protein ACRD2W_01190 [Acidimicrobiales bacterium]
MPRAAPVCHCRFSFVEAHHDKLVRAAADVGMALELLELAVTWGELDYTGESLIPPVDWLEFAAAHSWNDPELAQRLFSTARDVALRRPADGAPTHKPRTVAHGLLARWCPIPERHPDRRRLT